MVRANGLLQHFVRAGSGDPVVLLHGFAQTWLEWRRDIMPALAREYTVIAPDMRGVGDTERPVTGYEKRAMAEDLRALLEHLDLGPVFLAGHDFGAAVAYAYAAAYRDAVRNLVIMEMIIPGFGYEQAMQAPFAEDGLGRGSGTCSSMMPRTSPRRSSPAGRGCTSAGSTGTSLTIRRLSRSRISTSTSAATPRPAGSAR